MSGWTPLFASDEGNPSESQIEARTREQEFHQALLSKLDIISLQLQLLNARVEEAFETEIFEVDIE